MQISSLTRKVAIALMVVLTTSGVATVTPISVADAAQKGQRADPFAPRWFYAPARRDADGHRYRATAFYGPRGSDDGTTLTCEPSGIVISFYIGDPRPGLDRAYVRSGNLRMNAPTDLEDTELGTSLSFVIPHGAPVLANFPSNGFAISFSNGEHNPFPGGAVLSRLLAACASG